MSASKENRSFIQGISATTRPSVKGGFSAQIFCYFLWSYFFNQILGLYLINEQVEAEGIFVKDAYKKCLIKHRTLVAICSAMYNSQAINKDSTHTTQHAQ